MVSVLAPFFSGFSIICSWCISSEYKIVHLLSSAVAIIKESRKEKQYFLFKTIAVRMVVCLISTTWHISVRSKTVSSQTGCCSFNFLKQALCVSIITCELITGRFFNKSKAFCCFSCTLLSKAYTQILLYRFLIYFRMKKYLEAGYAEHMNFPVFKNSCSRSISIKILLIQVLACPFLYFTKIYGIFHEKLLCKGPRIFNILGLLLNARVFANRKSNNFYLLTCELGRKIQQKAIAGGNYNLSIHSFFSQKYK